MARSKTIDITLEELEKRSIFCILDIKEETIIAIIHEKEDICEGYMVKKHIKRGVEIDSFSILQKEIIGGRMLSRQYDLTKDFQKAIKFVEGEGYNKL